MKSSLSNTILCIAFILHISVEGRETSLANLYCCWLCYVLISGRRDIQESVTKPPSAVEVDHPYIQLLQGWDGRDEGTAKMVNQERGERRVIKETLDRRGHLDLACRGNLCEVGEDNMSNRTGYSTSLCRKSSWSKLYPTRRRSWSTVSAR